MGLEEEMKAFVKAGLAHHDSTCPMPAQAILLNPGNLELFGWTELFGVPVKPDDRVAPKRFRILCDGSAFGVEDAVEAFATETVPVRGTAPRPYGLTIRSRPRRTLDSLKRSPMQLRFARCALGAHSCAVL